jgi:hypothetical protein
VCVCVCVCVCMRIFVMCVGWCCGGRVMFAYASVGPSVVVHARLEKTHIDARRKKLEKVRDVSCGVMMLSYRATPLTLRLRRRLRSARSCSTGALGMGVRMYVV